MCCLSWEEWVRHLGTTAVNIPEASRGAQYSCYLPLECLARGWSVPDNELVADTKLSFELTDHWVFIVPFLTCRYSTGGRCQFNRKPAELESCKGKDRSICFSSIQPMAAWLSVSLGHGELLVFTAQSGSTNALFTYVICSSVLLQRSSGFWQSVPRLLTVWCVVNIAMSLCEHRFFTVSLA